MCKFNTLGDRLFSLDVFLLNLLSLLKGMSAQNPVIVSEQGFLSRIAFSVYEVVRVACQ